MPEIFTIKASDLVLKVSENIDPTIFDISKYEAFLDALCAMREFQKIYDNHLENKMRYRKIKPLTIIVTKDISACKRLTEKWISFIVEKEDISKEDAEKKNLIVTSVDEHKKNVLKLDRVDDKDDLTEWIKSGDTGFYSIEYSWEKGTHTKQGKFNPDFFLKTGNKIIVIEIKDDELINKVREGGDIAKETKAKYKYTVEHFDRLNGLQKEQRYYFTFLTPKDFDNFFGILRRGDFSGFRSQLDTELE